jgi:hypothetical protein
VFLVFLTSEPLGAFFAFLIAEVLETTFLKTFFLTEVCVLDLPFSDLLFFKTVCLLVF